MLNILAVSEGSVCVCVFGGRSDYKTAIVTGSLGSWGVILNPLSDRILFILHPHTHAPTHTPTHSYRCMVHMPLLHYQDQCILKSTAHFEYKQYEKKQYFYRILLSFPMFQITKSTFMWQNLCET